MPPSVHNLDIPRLRAQHLMMWRIRALEQAALRGLAKKEILGAIHPSIGQEAVAVGVVGNLRRDDFLLSTHRGHGHTLAKGANSEAMLRELLGRTGGTCGGKGGSMHIADFNVGMLGANGVVDGEHLVPFGVARLVRAGSDATLVSWSAQVHVCEQAAATLANEGIFVELLDLRTLWPWDKKAVLASVAKTGKLIVAHEAVSVAGFGAEIAATVAERTGAKIRRLGAPRAPIGYAPSLEDATRVTAPAIVAAVREMVRQ